jgi:hypothetical protein
LITVHYTRYLLYGLKSLNCCLQLAETFFASNLEGSDGGSGHDNGLHLVLVGVPLVVHAGDNGGGVEASGGGAACRHLTRAPGGVGVALLLLVPGPLQKTLHVFRGSSSPPGSRAPTENITCI